MMPVEAPVMYESIVDLGSPEKVFKQSFRRNFSSALGALFTLSLSGVLFYFLFFFKSGGKVSLSQANLIYFLAGAFVFVAGLFALWKVFVGWRASAVVYQNGFAYFDGRKKQIARWTDIASLSMKVVKRTYYGFIPIGTERTYTFVDVNGQKFKIDNTLDKVENLIEVVREKIYPYTYGRAHQAYEAGQTAQFGAANLNRDQGLQIGKKSFRWDEIDKMRVVNGMVEIKSKKKGLFATASAPIADISNADVFLELVSKAIQDHPV